MRLIDADKLRLSYWVSPTSTVSTAGQYYFYSQSEVDNAPTIEAVSVGTLEQFIWERDIAISQLEELGLSLGQKVDYVKEAIDKATPMKLKEVKGMYYITKPVCPRCGDDLFGEYCSECGQKLTQE